MVREEGLEKINGRRRKERKGPGGGEGPLHEKSYIKRKEINKSRV